MHHADMERVSAQAREVATGWSPAGAPASWRLTAQTFRAIADEPVLLELAAALPAERLPPLLLSAAIRYLVTDRRPDGLAHYYPEPGRDQPPLDEQFRPALVAFCAAERDALAELCAGHRYQMNEVGRSVAVLPVLGRVAARYGRPLALVDLGTGAGLGLQPDRYRYRYAGPSGEVVLGDAGSPLELACTVRGARSVPVPAEMPEIVQRVGVDVEPLDLELDEVRRWLAACIPPEAGAVTRFARAVEVAIAHPQRCVRGDMTETLPRLVAELAAEPVLCLLDSFVHVFLTPAELSRFHDALAEIATSRDLEWISIDPLVPLGPDARASVQGHPVPEGLITRNRRDGVFGVVGRLGWRDGERGGGLLGIAHPSGTWLEWFDPD